MKKILVVILFLLLTIPAMATNNKTYTINMRDLLRTYLNDNSGVTWTNAVCLNLLNVRCRWYATFCGIGKVDTIVTVNNQVNYALNYDFISTNEVMIKISGETRHRALDRRASLRSDPQLQTFGKDNATTHPAFYNVVQAKDSLYWLLLDTPESESTTDSIFVYYKAQATELTGDSTIINIPYSGVQLVLLGAFLDGLLMNRENPTTALALPIVDKMFDQYFQLYMIDRSDPQFKPGQ